MRPSRRWRQKRGQQIPPPSGEQDGCADDNEFAGASQQPGRSPSRDRTQTTPTCGPPWLSGLLALRLRTLGASRVPFRERRLLKAKDIRLLSRSILADSEIPCTKNVVGCSKSTGSSQIVRASAMFHLRRGFLVAGDTRNATLRPFSRTSPTGTLAHVTGVSCNPLTQAPFLRGAPVFGKGFVST